MGVSGSLQVKDGKYYAVLSLRTNELTKKGKIKYRTKWISTGFEVKGNKKRAKEFLNEKCREYSKRNVDYCDMYFADYMVEWLDEIEPEIRANTYRGYSGNVGNHIVPYFYPRRIKIQELEVSDLEDFYKYLVFEKSKSDGSEPLSPTTITHIHRCISKALNDAARKGIITVNVATLARKPHSVKFKSQYLNERQVNELLKTVKDTPIEVPVTICAVFGLRRGEVLGLKWKAVDMENRTITISEHFNSMSVAHILHRQRPKAVTEHFRFPTRYFNICLLKKESRRVKRGCSAAAILTTIMCVYGLTARSSHQIISRKIFIK